MRVNRTMTSAAAAAAVLLALTISAPPALAAPGITVAPSPNGLVMAGLPTTITPTGFTGKAKAYVFDGRSGKWQSLGTVRSGTPFTYAFPNHGRIKVKIAPKGKPAKTSVVPVYGRFVAKTDPWTFGDVQLPVGRSTSEFEPPVTMPASAGCALVDVGLAVGSSAGQSTSATLIVQSTGAPEARLPVSNSAAVLLGVPVKGDVTVSIVDYVNPDVNASKAGVVWYCAGGPRMAQVPS